MVLERTARDFDPGGGERRPDRVTFEGLDRAPVEREPQWPVAPDRFPLARGKTFAHAMVPGSLGRPRRPASPPRGSCGLSVLPGQPRRPNLIRRRVPLGEEPRAAPVAVQPPLRLPAAARSRGSRGNP